MGLGAAGSYRSTQRMCFLLPGNVREGKPGIHCGVCAETHVNEHEQRILPAGLKTEEEAEGVNVKKKKSSIIAGCIQRKVHRAGSFSTPSGDGLVHFSVLS